MLSPVSVCLLVGWFVRGIPKTTEYISTILGRRMGSCPIQTPLTFGADETKILFSHFLSNIGR